METKDELTSQFNDAKLQVMRLHDIWVELKRLRESGNLTGTIWKLDSAMIELWNDISRLGYSDKVNDIDKDIIKSIKSKNQRQLYINLVEKEKILREVQSKSGKGDKFGYRDDDGMT